MLRNLHGFSPKPCTQDLAWLPRIVVACARIHPAGGAAVKPGAQLMLYPRYHLDASSLLATYPLAKVCPPNEPLYYGFVAGISRV